MSNENTPIMTESPNRKFYVYACKYPIIFEDVTRPIRFEYINTGGGKEGYTLNIDEAIELANAFKSAVKDHLIKEMKEKID